MLMPKRVKHRKVQRGSMKGKAKGGTELAFGAFGIQALESHWITNRQIEAARIAMTRHMKRGGRVWITIFPDKPISKKPLETRMGKGKGNPEEWVAVVKPGRIMFEIDGVVEETAREAMRLAMTKLPIKCKMVISPDGPNLNIKSNVAQILAELEADQSAEGAEEGATETAAAEAPKQEAKEEGE